MGVTASAANDIVIGRSVHTVRILGTLKPNTLEVGTLHIKGDLVVDGECAIKGTTLLGTEEGSRVYMRENKTNKYFWLFHRTESEHADMDRTYGSVTAAGVTVSAKGTSDRRLKNVGKPFTCGLDKIRRLEVFNYTFKNDETKTPRVGVMAQDLQKIFPDAVIKGEDGFLRIRMEDMFYALVNAVKENDKRITALEKQNKDLIKRIEVLEKPAPFIYPLFPVILRYAQDDRRKRSGWQKELSRRQNYKS